MRTSPRKDLTSFSARPVESVPSSHFGSNTFLPLETEVSVEVLGLTMMGAEGDDVGGDRNHLGS